MYNLIEIGTENCLAITIKFFIRFDSFHAECCALKVIVISVQTHLRFKNKIKS